MKISNKLSLLGIVLALYLSPLVFAHFLWDHIVPAPGLPRCADYGKHGSCTEADGDAHYVTLHNHLSNLAPWWLRPAYPYLNSWHVFGHGGAPLTWFLFWPMSVLTLTHERHIMTARRQIALTSRVMTHFSDKYTACFFRLHEAVGPHEMTKEEEERSTRYHQTHEFTYCWDVY